MKTKKVSKKQKPKKLAVESPYGEFIKEFSGFFNMNFDFSVHVNKFSKGVMVDIVHKDKNVFHTFILD